MHKLGLVGKDISHSRSREMYEKLLNEKVDYHLLDFQREEDVYSAQELFDQGFEGISITYPYKKTFLNEVLIENELIRSLNSINCIGRFQGKLFATNTDYLAAEFLLKNHTGSEFIILGDGNMAKIFTTILQKNGEDFRQVFRSRDGNLNDIEYKKRNEKSNFVVINCCSRLFCFSGKLPMGTTFWDMNYSFLEHLHLANDKNLKYIEGVDLLFEQARFALQFWKIKPL